MNKKIFLFIFIISLISITSALELGLTPSSINIETNKGQSICANFSLKSNREVTLRIKDRWSENESRDLKNYNLEKEQFKINLIAPETITFSGKKEIKICFEGEKSGEYHGAILFESENGYVSVGTWINLKIKNNFFGITGNSILEEGKKNILFLAIIPELILLGFILKKFIIKK